MFQVILMSPDWILIKQIIVFSPSILSAGEGNRFSKNATWGNEYFLSVWRGQWQEPGAEFWLAGGWVRMSKFNAFFRNIDYINLKFLANHGEIYRKDSTNILEKDKAGSVYRNMNGYVLETNLEGLGW